MEKIKCCRYLQCKFCSYATNFRLLCIQGRDCPKENEENCPKENEAIKNTNANANEDKSANVNTNANTNTNCAMRIEYVTPQVTCLYPGERLSNRE